MQSELKILMADDHKMLRKGIKIMLEFGPFKNTKFIEVDNGIDALSILSQQRFDVVLLDLNMPKMDGMTLLRKLKAEKIDAHVLVLSSHCENNMIRQTLDNGALGYLLKDSGPEELFKAIDTVRKGQKYYSNEVTQLILGAREKKQDNGIYDEVLTVREIQILKLIVKDMSNEQIADTLSISKRTVEGHRRNIRTKLKIKTTTGLLKFGLENGFLQS